MEWFSENWFWVIIFILFIVLHMFGHGGHGMHGGHGGQAHGKATDEDKSEKSEHRLYFGNYGITPLIKHADKIIVGEAAGFQDANWGFGMRHAIESGYLAARAIIERQDYWCLAKHEVISWVKSS